MRESFAAKPFAQSLRRSLDSELRRRRDIAVTWRLTSQNRNDSATSEMAILASDVFIPILSRTYLTDQFSQRELLLITSFQRQLRQVFPVTRRPLSIQEERNLPHTFRDLKTLAVWRYPYGMFDLAEELAIEIAKSHGCNRTLAAGIEMFLANANQT